MAQCRDLENHHHEKLLEISINTLEKILKGELDEDLPDDLRAVSTVGGVVGTAGEARVWRAGPRAVGGVECEAGPTPVWSAREPDPQTQRRPLAVCGSLSLQSC